jgi:hypothetical protein
LKAIPKTRSGLLYPTLSVLAASLLAACGGGSDGPGQIAFLPPAASQPAGSGNTNTNTNTSVSGVLTASAFKPGSSTDPVVAPGYYAGATVCVDTNGNGRCDTGEPASVTDANGKFSLSVSSVSALIADIGTNARNTATNTNVPAREVLRVMLDQVQEQGTAVVVSPLSSEVARLVEANHTSYAVEKQNLATRLGVPAASLLADASATSGTVQTALLNEANALNNRFAYATASWTAATNFPMRWPTPAAIRA